MQPAVHPRPVRVIVEIDPAQVSSLVTQLVHRLIPRASQHPEARPEQDEQPEEEAPSLIDRVNDPPPCRSHEQDPDLALVPSPVPANGHKPRLPHQFSAKTFYVGRLCDQGHTEAGAPFSVRYKSSHSCVTCEHQRAATRRGQRQAPQKLPPPVVPTNDSSPPHPREGAEERQERPELPGHLRETCFLSPIVCEIPTHRYRGSRFTLRFLSDEDCVKCITEQSKSLKAGD